MRAVFDLDDTISIHKNRDYPNAKPIDAVIEKMRQMKKDGWEIIIYTARGQVSCKGDIKLIKEKNEEVIKTWLKKHDVPCDELIFGKPIADLYIDDKGMGLREFINSPFCELKGGGSGKRIYRFGDTVKKDFSKAEDVQRFKEWIEDNGGVCLYPKIQSYLYDSVYMDYIDGENLCECFGTGYLDKLLAVINLFENRKITDEFTIQPQIDILQKNYGVDNEFNTIVAKCSNALRDHEEEMAEHRSYCHGDMTLSNVITKDGELYFIDSRYVRNSSTYLFDLAKLRMSLSGYERLFGISQKDNRLYLKEFDRRMTEVGLKSLVLLLNLMYVCRLYRYKDENGKIVVKTMAKEILAENEGLLSRD